MNACHYHSLSSKLVTLGTYIQGKVTEMKPNWVTNFYLPKITICITTNYW